ncbi:hypothetical protein [Streptomyces sp. TRM68367]|uniref:hypothetical protein n=1 Tax=Streptomyces sp. TRM68367 TaxID=2758415 RepID=UPI00165B00D9|nr:hypothetical protein [Streptomyces sp. TRM68367]MBC9731221.1 hypothetical protein [Streptomyces sp. TRM68367]
MDRPTVRQALARLADWFRTLREQLAHLAHRLAEALAPLARLAQQARTHRGRRHRDRPAWASPYGPAPRRSR